MNLNRRNFLFGSAAATALAGCATDKTGTRTLKPGEKANVALIGFGIQQRSALMPQFVERLEPIAGTTPPSIIQDGIILAENKNPGLSQHFNGLDFRRERVKNFLQNTQQYMKDRPGFAYELFPKYKGYYPYYYFFGNLKATRKGYTSLSSSNSGVN